MEHNPSKKLTGPELVKKFHAFCGTRRFISVCIRRYMKQDRQYAFYIILRRVRVTTLSVEKQKYYTF
jgi:hypothetical protein